MKKIIIILLIVALVGVTGRFLLNKKIAAIMAPKVGPVAVLMVKAVPQSIETLLKAPGTIYSNESAKITSELAGKITSINFTEGQEVKAGALLLEVDNRIAASEYNASRAAYNLAKITFDRRQALQRKGAYSIQDKDDAKAKFEQSRANLAISDERLKKAKIYAPFAGSLGLRYVSQGDFINIGQEITSIDDYSTVKIDFSVPEKSFSRLSEGQEISLSVDAVPGEKFSGKVIAIDPKIDPVSRNITMRAKVDNAEKKLRPGMFANVELKTSAKENVILLPEQALVPTGSELFVFKVVDGKAAKLPVKVGVWQNGKVEVISGIEPGDVIITDGQMKIKTEGQEVVDANAPKQEDSKPKTTPVQKNQDKK